MNTFKLSPVRNLLACAGLLGCALLAAAQANPTVVNGQATFARNGSVYSITNTPGTILQWPGFSIAAGDTTRFIQQSANSTVLNRITGQEPSLILGALQSNGRVFLVNPNGVLFGAGARVDVNGLVASSLGISNADFLAGKMNFSAGANAGRVANQGRIATPEGGRVLLIAPNVENTGLIQAPGGEVVLAAGRSVQLADSTNPDLQVVVSAPQDQAVNLGQIMASSGRVGIYGALVNQRGLVSADSASVGEGGKIVFKASGDLLLEAGSQTRARGASQGGSISLAGERVGLTGDAVVDASGQAGGGTVLAGNAAASQLFASSGSSIRADALESGNGGTVLALSGGVTRVYGQISTRGGAASGDGGFIETSGKTLDMQGQADTRAPHGKTGKLLLDPTNIYIATDAATAQAAGMEAGSPLAEGAGTFVAMGPVRDSLMRISTLASFLATADVTVSTANGPGTGAGNINVVSPVDIPMLRTLTLNADAGIQLNAVVTVRDDATLALNATTGIQINASPFGYNYSNLVMRTTGGNIVQTVPLSAYSLDARADTGSVNLGLGNNVFMLAGASGGPGGFTFNSNSNVWIGNAGGVGSVTAGGTGPINVQASSLSIRGQVASDAGNVTLQTTSPGDALQILGAGSVLSNTGRVTAQGVVLRPSLNDCIASPAAPNCNLVLPTLAACMANNALPGCSVVLPPAPPPPPPGPTLDICIAAPATGGCAELLPSLAVCAASPTIPGCSVVLPTVSACIASPTSAGCAAVLPSLSSCIATPTVPGCSVVLPTLQVCTANPVVAGCSSVLPSVATCVAAPGAAGCSAVLPPLSLCVANPTAPGCSVVLPSLASCVALPTAPGCSVVLPSLTRCVATPSLPGCSVVLPALNQCVASPSLAGCTVVLPNVAQCVANPALGGCGVVLPALSQCIASPALSGCSAVLPTLAQCTAAPTLQGCSVVLPPISACAANPTAPGCSVVLPPTQQTSNTPVSEAINTTVNVINTANSSSTPPANPAVTPARDDKAAELKKDDQKEQAVTDKSGTKNEPAKKMYCN